MEAQLRAKEAEHRVDVDRRLAELTEELEEEKAGRIASLAEAHRIEIEGLAEMAGKVRSCVFVCVRV